MSTEFKNVTLYASHGARYNLQEEYKQLPCQTFWTWITGKGVALESIDQLEFMKPVSFTRTFLHLLGAWLIIGLSVFFAHSILHTGNLIEASLATTFCWLAVVNRARCLQATFHYMTHGAAMPSTKLAHMLATLFFTTPFFYTGWRNYSRDHVTEHHHMRILGTQTDPDVIFLKTNGLHTGMKEIDFWLHVWFRPFAPMFIFDRTKESLRQSFIEPKFTEILFRISFWFGAIAMVWGNDLVLSFLLLFVLPALLFFQHSLWLQLITEHLWFMRSESDVKSSINQLHAYGRLTWGRFQGRSLPRAGLLSWLIWIARIFCYDLPVRLYVYPQDLPSHDFHHRQPLTPFHSIADLRSTAETTNSRFGPYFEVWGFLSSLRLMRDHICFGDNMPFRHSVNPHYLTNESTCHYE
jgi:hypothetical protein